MSFDPRVFEAEVALKFIRTDQLPAAAQDAFEEGFDSPRLLRLAVLEGRSFSEIDAALPGMLADIGCTAIPAAEAALRLAKRRASAVLYDQANALASLSYFHSLLVAGDYPDELADLGWLGDELENFYEGDIERQSSSAMRLRRSSYPRKIGPAAGGIRACSSKCTCRSRSAQGVGGTRVAVRPRYTHRSHDVSGKPQANLG